MLAGCTSSKDLLQPCLSSMGKITRRIHAKILEKSMLHSSHVRRQDHNVVDLIKLQPQSERPHGLEHKAFDALLKTDKPIILAEHDEDPPENCNWKWGTCNSAHCGRENRRQHATCWLMLMLFFVLSGCVSMAPSYQQPPLPVATAYPDAPLTVETDVGQGTIATGWRYYFSDPPLQTLIKLALDNNRDLRTAVLRVEEARAVHGIQRAEQFPTIGSRAGVDRSRIPADLSPTGKPVEGSQYQVALGLASWEVDFWGRIRNLKEAALENYLATDAARRAASISLVAQVANSYLSLREVDERLVLARRAITNRAESLRIFTRRVQVGSTSRLDLTQVQTLLTQAQALGAQLEQLRAAQAQALTLLIGTPVDLPARPDTLGEQAVLVELRPGLPSDLLIQRPDIVAAEHQLKAANANIGAARAAFFPNITLTGSFGTASAELEGLFASGSHAWVFSPSISLPLFDGGQRRNNLNLTEARRDLAVAAYEKAVQSAFRDVADALSARHWLAEQLAIAQTAEAVQTERARLSQLRYDNGAATFLEVLDAGRELLSAEQQVVQIRRALLTSRVSLYAALGGGAMDFAPLPVSARPNSTRGTLNP
jgi:multidrug efflux system outer membrane protein